MKPSNNIAPEQVTLEGWPEVNRARWASDVYGEPGLRRKIHGAYVTTTLPEEAHVGPHETHEWFNAGPFMGKRKTETARLKDRSENELEIGLSPEISGLLLNALHKQAELRGIQRIKHAVKHPLATYASLRLRKTYARYDT